MIKVFWLDLPRLEQYKHQTNHFLLTSSIQIPHPFSPHTHTQQTKNNSKQQENQNIHEQGMLNWCQYTYHANEQVCVWYR